MHLNAQKRYFLQLSVVSPAGALEGRVPIPVELRPESPTVVGTDPPPVMIEPSTSEEAVVVSADHPGDPAEKKQRKAKKAKRGLKERFAGDHTREPLLLAPSRRARALGHAGRGRCPTPPRPIRGRPTARPPSACDHASMQPQLRMCPPLPSPLPCCV
jgi:hypothetical protein